MGMQRCIVVAEREATRSFLASLLQSWGLDAVLLTSLGELPGTLAVVPTIGILLELGSLVTASAKDKKAAQELLEYYPCAKFRLVDGKVLTVGETLELFLRRCLELEPRLTRKSVRKTLHVAVLLSSTASFARAEKSVTVNLSDTGIFVYSARRWKLGKRVWMKFPGYTSTLSGIVRSCQPWGETTSFPGVGIELDARLADRGDTPVATEEAAKG